MKTLKNIPQEEPKHCTFKELLLDTIEHYFTHPRAEDEAMVCKYLDVEGRRCAVGRCLDPSWLGALTLIGYYQSSGDQLRPHILPEYENITDDQWVKLQNLHDSEGVSYWNKRRNQNGQRLSSKGLLAAVSCVNESDVVHVKKLADRLNSISDDI